ncbi:MAG TPA: nitroreductase family protein [Acetobacteraceae bacterium]|nr:nitroreductase family protein [Acetobacteraceae bacterium]
MSEVGLFEAIYTARALRRLKPDPVPEALLDRVLEAATQAPSAGNAQNWIFIVVRDAEQRRALGAVYRKAADEIAEIYAARGRPAHLTEAQYQRFMAAGSYLWDHLGEAPVLLVPCLKARDMPPREALPQNVAARYHAHLAYQERIRGASIYPAMQNIILACRALGLGTLITTNHILYEEDARAILGLPDDVSTFALMPVGFPRDKYGPLTRRPVAEVAFADRWGTPWPS